MEGSNKNVESTIVKKIEQIISIEHPDCKKTIHGRKAVLSKKTEKIYRVTVTYIQIADEEATIKRSIIENILRK